MTIVAALADERGRGLDPIFFKDSQDRFFFMQLYCSFGVVNYKCLLNERVIPIYSDMLTTKLT